MVNGVPALLVQMVVVVYSFAKDFRRDALIELQQSISRY